MKTKTKTKTKTAKQKIQQKSLVEIYCGNIAGVQYGDSQTTTLKAGQKLKLTWERNNRFDPNAIRIDTEDDVKLGYIKKEDTDLLHEYREASIKLHTQLRSVNPNNPSWCSLVVVVRAERLIDEDAIAMTPDF